MIGIITFHRADNYGAVLQAYALQYYTENKLGKDAEIVDLMHTEIDNAYSYSEKCSLKERFLYLLKRKKLKIRSQRYESFREKYFKMSKTYTPQTIDGAVEKYGSFITGSDQVFNLEIIGKNAREYLLFFADTNKNNLYSYAASLGKIRLTENDKKIYLESLQRFSEISIREESCVEQMEAITKKRVFVHIDPVLLLDQCDWKLLCGETKKKEYVLVYAVAATEYLFKMAKHASDLTGCEVVYIGQGLKKKFEYPSFHFVENAGPVEFLTLFNNASYVVTSSFHGTAFSILFHKKFIVLLNKNNQKNNRILDITEKLGLKENVMWDEEDISKSIFKEVDWIRVDKELELLRRESSKYLSEISE